MGLNKKIKERSENMHKNTGQERKKQTNKQRALEKLGYIFFVDYDH